MGVKKSTSHVEVLSENETIFYPNFNDFESGQEPAIVIKRHSGGGISLIQGDQSIVLPNNCVKEFGGLIGKSDYNHFNIKS